MYQYANKSITFSLSKQIKKGLLAAALLILVSMNIATLISGSFYTAVYAALGTALGYMLTDKMLSRSPTVIRKKDIASTSCFQSQRPAGFCRIKRFSSKYFIDLIEENDDAYFFHVPI